MGNGDRFLGMRRGDRFWKEQFLGMRRGDRFWKGLFSGMEVIKLKLIRINISTMTNLMNRNKV
ncbi:MAG: hypothetical protein ACKN9A_19960, partial [Microcystis aeruginosa]